MSCSVSMSTWLRLHDFLLLSKFDMGWSPFLKDSAKSQQWLMSCSVSMSTWLRLHDFWLLVVRCPRLIWDGALLASGTKDMRSARTPPLIHKVQLSVEKKGVVGWVPPLGGLFFVRVGFQSWRLYSVLWYLRFVCIRIIFFKVELVCIINKIIT